jgi:hypothetical protein
MISSIEICGIQILEPAATISDLAVSAVCFFAFFKLKKMHQNIISFKYFNYFFLSMGIATIFGGLIGHAFIYVFDFACKLPAWLTSMVSISLLERASIKHAKSILNPIVSRTYEIVNVVELLIFMTITFSTLNFFYVEIHSGFGLNAVILPIQLFVYIKTKNKASKLFLWGIGVTMISAFFFMTQISISFWIDYLCISHTFMAIAAYIFYRACYNLRLS